MSAKSQYCCSKLVCSRAPLEPVEKGLKCPTCGDSFFFVPGTEVPEFISVPEATNEYSQVDAAELHDNSLRWVFDTFQTNEEDFRERLVALLDLKGGERVLITGTGAGNDLPYLARALSGKGEIYAQDIAKEMLLAGISRWRDRLTESGVVLHFSVSDALQLPFGDKFFDAAFHFGGINEFLDIRVGIAEMDRVVKPGGTVVIGDEGVAPWLVNTELGQMLISNNPLYASEVPLSALPPTARNVMLAWELSNCFYVIRFEASASPPNVDIDVPHLGKRGGSVRTRYFGPLEGIDPYLRDRIYAEAEGRGTSRVAFLEAALLESLERD